MNCESFRRAADALLDGELDAVTAAQAEGHRAECRTCERLLQSRAALVRAVAEAPYFRAPDGLAPALRAARAAPRRRTRWLQAAAFAGVTVLSGVFGAWLGQRPGDRIANEVLASHVRALLPDNVRVAVVSSDRHTVKPWFAGKLDYSPPVLDESHHGFALAGGRLDYVGGRPVAALVYRHRRHWITLFVWPGHGPATPSATSLDGYHLVHWSARDMQFWLVSDADTAALEQLARLLIAG